MLPGTLGLDNERNSLLISVEVSTKAVSEITARKDILRLPLNDSKVSQESSEFILSEHNVTQKPLRLL